MLLKNESISQQLGEIYKKWDALKQNILKDRKIIETQVGFKEKFLNALTENDLQSSLEHFSKEQIVQFLSSVPKNDLIEKSFT